MAKGEERLTSSLLSVDMLNAPRCLFKVLAHSLNTHAYPTRPEVLWAMHESTRGFFTVPKSRTEYGRRTVLGRSMATWNSIPDQVTDRISRIRFKKQTKVHLME